MKQIITIVGVIFFYQFLHAQEPDTTLQQELEKVYTELDTANLNTQLLFDKTVDLFDIEKLKGNGDTSVTNKDIYQLYLQANNMSFDQEGYISTDSLIKIANEHYGVLNPLLITWYQYDRIKDSAFADGLLDTLNGQIVDVQDPPESPYLQDTFFAFSPAFHTYPDAGRSL